VRCNLVCLLQCVAVSSCNRTCDASCISPAVAMLCAESPSPDNLLATWRCSVQLPAARPCCASNCRQAPPKCITKRSCASGLCVLAPHVASQMSAQPMPSCYSVTLANSSRVSASVCAGRRLPPHLLTCYCMSWPHCSLLTWHAWLTGWQQWCASSACHCLLRAVIR
jgi:hypothetical protein